MHFTEHIPRLPVTLKTTEATTPTSTFSTPSIVYLPPPGPPHIYAPNQIQTVTKPPNVYLPATSTQKPTNTYLPPTNPTTTTTRTTPRPAVKPDNAYLPVEKPANTYLPVVEKPTNVYLPAHNSSIIHKPPVKPSTASPPTINLELVPPTISSERPTEACASSLSCCDEASEGKIVIPIVLKSHGSGSCCGRVAKLILPVVGLDKESIRKLSTAHPDEIDATQLIKDILRSFLL